MNLYILQNINDHNSGALEQFMKIYPEKACQIFFDKNHPIDKTNAYVKSIISQTKHFTVKQGNF